MARNKWALRIADAIAEIECNADPNMGMWLALQHLQKMRIEALEPAERQVYNYIAELNRPVVSGHIAEEFGLKPNHASGLLKALTTYCLLDRQLELDNNGRRFVYTVHNM
jgi:hypothetical protein